MNVMETYDQSKAKQLDSIFVKEESQVNEPKSIANRSSRRHFSIANLNKLSQPKHTKIRPESKEKNKRKASVNSGRDFVSVVRANATA